ncbi:MAG: hypothetical protein ACOYXA_07135 [Bacteroidota bacterium]
MKNTHHYEWEGEQEMKEDDLRSMAYTVMTLAGLFVVAVSFVILLFV